MEGPMQIARAAVTSWITSCDRIGDAEHAGTGSDLDCQIQHVLNIKLQASNGLTGSASKNSRREVSGSVRDVLTCITPEAGACVAANSVNAARIGWTPCSASHTLIDVDVASRPLKSAACCSSTSNMNLYPAAPHAILQCSNFEQ